MIGVVDLERAEGRILYQSGYTSDCVERMLAHIDEVIVAYRSIPNLPALNDEPISTHRALSQEFIETSPYTREMTAKYGIVDSLDLFLIAEPGRIAEFGLSRHASRGVVTDADMDVLRLLAPHIRRAVTIGDLIDMKHLETQALGATLDSVAVGVVIVADKGRILHANEAARRMLATASPIRASGGRLSALQADVTNELLRAIAL